MFVKPEGFLDYIEGLLVYIKLNSCFSSLNAASK